jgi:hypothetical protein
MREEFDPTLDLEWGLSCPACTQPRAFERPPCPDGHGDDCPERICIACGTALIVAVMPTGERGAA